MLFDILCILLKFIAVHLVCDLHIIPFLLTNIWWRISWAIGLGVPDLFSIFPLSCVAKAWDYSCVILMSIAVLEKIVYILPYRQSTKSSSCPRKLVFVTNENKYFLLLKIKKKIKKKLNCKVSHVTNPVQICSYSFIPQIFKNISETINLNLND